MAGHEWKRAGRDLNFSVVDMSSPSPDQRSGQAAGQARTVASDDGQAARRNRIQKQQRVVDDLGKSLDEKKKSLDELNAGLNQAENQASSTTDSSDQIADEIRRVQSNLGALRDERDQVASQQSQQYVTDQVRDEGRKLNNQIVAAQLRDQLQAESSVLANLNYQVQQIAMQNIDTDQLHQAQAAAQAQSERVNGLTSQYRQYQVQVAEQEAADRARQREAGTTGYAAAQSDLDSQIRDQESQLSKLQQDYQASQSRGQAGSASSEAVYNRLKDQQREYDDLASRYTEEKKTLDQMKKEPIGG